MTGKKIEKAYDIIRNYVGENNKLRYMRKLYESGKLGVLSEFDVEYINNNYDYKIQYPNKVVSITRDLGTKLYDKNNLDFIPEKIKITKIIGEMGGSIHCYVKYRQSIPESLMWVQKNGILNPINNIDWKNYDVDFTRFDKIRPLKEHQKEGVKFLLANKKCVLADSMGLGKEQPVDTIIPTPYGYIRFGDLKIGDYVFSSDGKEHKVLGVFPQGVKNVYEVKFSDGSTTLCGLDHLWIVNRYSNGKKIGKEDVLSLREIIAEGLRNKGERENNKKYHFAIPITRPVNYTSKSLDLDPYELGVMIGESHNEELNLQHFQVSESFIPAMYLTSNIKQRKALLSGLMDANGQLRKGNNFITFISWSKKLTMGIKELVESLGGLINIKRYESNNSEKFILKIRLPFCPFRLNKKKEKFSLINNENQLIRYIDSIKIKGQMECQCIKVDSYNESYLTSNYIVTHNTTTSIVASLAGNYKHILIICPASLKSNWKKEISFYEDENNINIINGSNWKEAKKFTIINYDIIDNFYEIAQEPVYEKHEVKDKNGKVVEVINAPVYIKKDNGEYVMKMKKSNKKELIKEALKNSPLFLTDYDCVIIDEAQKLSNKGSIRYRTISDFLKKGNPESIFLITGTPITNNPMNLYNILSLIDCNITKDYNYYIKKFCNAREMHLKDGRVINIMGKPQNLYELREKIKPIYLRRIASEVGDMVGKQVIRKYYDLTPIQTDQYNKLWDEYQRAQEEQGNDDSEEYRKLVEGTLVRQYLAKEMVAHTIDMVDDLIDNGEKVVIMTCFKEEMDMFIKHYGKKCVYYRGGMTAKQKDKAQSDFNNNDKVMIFIGQVIAAGTGISLPSAKYCIFNSYSWSYSDNVQAEDRIYRLTQTRDVECIYQLFTDSISQDMFDKVIYKKYLQDSLIKTENNK